METKIVQEKLAECYLHEGVNHKQNCAELAQRYLNMYKNYRVSRQLSLRHVFDPPYGEC